MIGSLKHRKFVPEETMIQMSPSLNMTKEEVTLAKKEKEALNRVKDVSVRLKRGERGRIDDVLIC